MENVTKEEFKKFLEEMNVVIADIGAGQPKEAWQHFNTFIYDINKKEIKLNERSKK